MRSAQVAIIGYLAPKNIAQNGQIGDQLEQAFESL